MSRKKMKIRIDRVEEIQAELDRVQKRSRVREISSAETIGRYAAHIKNRLDELNVPKSKRQGMRFVVSPYSEPFANAYNGIPKGTMFSLYRGSRNWFVTDIFRHPCNESSNNEIEFTNEYEYRQYYSFSEGSVK